MDAMIELPYGRVPYPLDLGRAAAVVGAVPIAAPRNLPVVIDASLAAPSCGPPVRPGARVVIIVSDATRNETRRWLLEAGALPGACRPVALATGSHGQRPRGPLDLPLALVRAARLIVPRDTNLVDCRGASRRNPVHVARSGGEIYVVIIRGSSRPPNVAGFTAGELASSPGRGNACALRKNRAREVSPCLRAGVIDGDRCRVPPDCVTGSGTAYAVVASEQGSALRARAARARAARAREPSHMYPPRLAGVVAADVTPITHRFYQAATLEPIRAANQPTLCVGILLPPEPDAVIALVTAFAPHNAARGPASSANEFLVPRAGPAVARRAPRRARLLPLQRMRLREARS